MSRIPEVDALRGIAILLMVIYHFFFDMAYFGISDIKLYELSWILFQRLIGFLFIFVAGISLTLSESRNKEGYQRHAKRALKLGGVALLITIVTWIYPHKGFIMFGIIHFLALATLLAPFFFRFGFLNILLGALLILGGFYIDELGIDSQNLFWLGITYPGYMPLDHYAMIPWFGVVLLGIYTGQKLFPEGRPFLKNELKLNRLCILGRNSLLIYLVHQPILVASIMLWKLLL